MVETSQQQIQRVETGKVAARLELATKLSEVLGKPLDVVFPGSGKVLQKLANEFKGARYLPEETFTELNEHSVEGDPRIWFVTLLLRGHEEPLIFEISAVEKRRLFSAIQNERGGEDSLSFVVFDASNQRIAVNLSELIYCHFLFESSDIIRDTKDEPSEVRVFFCGTKKPLFFSVEPDVGCLDDEDDSGEFRHILYMLDTYSEKHNRYHFTDEDGEDVFLRAGDIALLEVPLWVIEPEESPDEEDSEISNTATGE